MHGQPIEPKMKSFDRRLKILRRAAACQFGIVFHREGGMGMHDRDVKRLVRDGLLRFKRGRVKQRKVDGEWVNSIQPLSPKRFVGNFRRDFRHADEEARERARRANQAPGCRPRSDPFPIGGGLYGDVNITLGVITEEGRAFLEKYSLRS